MIENIVTFCVLASFVHAIICLKKNAVHNIILLAILSVSFVTEGIALLLIQENNNLELLYTISFIFHHGLWLFLILRKAVTIRTAVLLIFFFAFSISNLLYYEGPTNLNSYTFVVGAFLYIIIFIVYSFYKLKIEDFPYFQSNYYLLLFSPIIFFFGLSFTFAFKSRLLYYTFVIGNIELYHVIGIFVNFIYYTLINVYIYREKRLKHAG